MFNQPETRLEMGNLDLFKGARSAKSGPPHLLPAWSRYNSAGDSTCNCTNLEAQSGLWASAYNRCL